MRHYLIPRVLTTSGNDEISSKSYLLRFGFDIIEEEKYFFSVLLPEGANITMIDRGHTVWYDCSLNGTVLFRYYTRFTSTGIFAAIYPVSSKE